MFIKGSHFASFAETKGRNPVRPHSVKSNKKVMFEFQKHKQTKAAFKDMQLQQSLKILDKYFEEKKKCFSSLIELSYNTLIKDNYKELHLRLENSSPTIKKGIKEDLGGINHITLLGRASKTPDRITSRAYFQNTILKRCSSTPKRNPSGGMRKTNSAIGDRKMQKHISALHELLEPCRIAKMELQSRLEENKAQCQVLVQAARHCCTPNPRRIYQRRRNKLPKEIFGGWEGDNAEELDVFNHKN